ncbi:MAG: helix-hairpin-helix domain-containing protein [Pirellulales bacterium]
MSDLSSSDAKQSDNEPFVYDPAQGWTALSAIVIVLALVQFALYSRQARLVDPPRFKVDINQASEAELMALPDLGPQVARRIVEFREQHGPFEKADDLRRVPGIGPATMRTLRPMVTASDPSRIAKASSSESDGEKGSGRSYAQK